MVSASVADFAETLRNGRLLEPTQLLELNDLLTAHAGDVRALAGELIQRGWLTAYQVNQILRGRAEELMLGSYVLLERLGAGGMGEVFKARNWKLGKIVALKLIRSERLANVDAVRRFQREVRAAALLNHANIVHAFDCDEAAGKHFFVMEYVEGVDLAKYVKEHGPLGVALACDCVRQAALGLQHAFERGLVHRDIKPHNLLLIEARDGRQTADRLIRILDMGLARLSEAGDPGDSTSVVTAEGTVMGTLDYIAPEQARNAHAADTRSDLYSLGCTFYFLLTGRVPFPGGTAAEKLLRHQMEQPTPVEQLRPGLASGVAAIVRKLMARRPEDRYQTPAEAAADLASVLSDPNAIPPLAGQPEPAPPLDSQAMQDTSSGWSSLVAQPLAESGSSSGLKQKAKRRQMLWLACAGGVAVLGAIGLLVALWSGSKRESEPVAPPVTVEKPRPIDLQSLTFDVWLEQVPTLSPEKQVQAVAAQLRKFNPGFDGKVQSTIEDGVVVRLDFLTDHITDLSPLRALPRLRHLACAGSRASKGRLADLSPLKGMKLQIFNCNFTRVADLSTLHGMPLRQLHCVGTEVKDLTPLQGMKLLVLGCGGNPDLKDLSPLKGMPLHTLHMQMTGVSDLTPLKGMRLTSLAIRGTRVKDLTPLKGMPLTFITCDIRGEETLAFLRTFPQLQMINQQPAAKFWAAQSSRLK